MISLGQAVISLLLMCRMSVGVRSAASVEISYKTRRAQELDYSISWLFYGSMDSGPLALASVIQGQIEQETR